MSVIYRGRALPLCWVVLEQKSATVALAKYELILREAAQLLPPRCQVTLLADRGFNDVELMKLCVELGWHFVIRLKESLVVYRPFKRRCKIAHLMPRQGEIALFDSVQITERRFGPVYLALGHMKPHMDMKSGPWSVIVPRVSTPLTATPCASTWRRAFWTINPGASR